AASALRQGEGQGPRLSRRIPCPLPRAALHRPVRREGSDPGCEKRRLNPLGGAPVEMGTTPRRCPHPTGEQNQKKRTFDVLPKPDKLIRYRQIRSTRCGARRRRACTSSGKPGSKTSPPSSLASNASSQPCRDGLRPSPPSAT